MTDPERMVWAAAFTQTLINSEDQEVAVEVALRAVSALRSIRVRGRHEQTPYRMLREFRGHPSGGGLPHVPDEQEEP